jgi:hypothetical protein
MREFLDPTCPEYRFDWQCAFSKRRKLLGAHVIVHSQRFVSVVRVMHRQLAAGGKPSFSTFRTIQRSKPEQFLEDRLNRRLVAAINRGESSRSLALRGFFGKPLKSR